MPVLPEAEKIPAETDRGGRTPVETGKAAHAFVSPDGRTGIGHRDIPCGTDPHAGAAAPAVVTGRHGKGFRPPERHFPQHTENHGYRPQRHRFQEPPQRPFGFRRSGAPGQDSLRHVPAPKGPGLKENRFIFAFHENRSHSVMGHGNREAPRKDAVPFLESPGESRQRASRGDAVGAGREEISRRPIPESPGQFRHHTRRPGTVNGKDKAESIRISEGVLRGQGRWSRNQFRAEIFRQVPGHRQGITRSGEIENSHAWYNITRDKSSIRPDCHVPL